MNPNWSGKIVAGMDRALLEMTTDIHNRAKILAPVDSRNLVNSAVIEPITNGYRVKFGSKCHMLAVDTLKTKRIHRLKVTWRKPVTQ